jgi:hypothetical protein
MGYRLNKEYRMDVILIDCRFYLGDQRSTCLCESRRGMKKLFGVLPSNSIPICSEVMCNPCPWKDPRVKDKKVKKTKEK